jgi:hypothetical protein
MSELSLNQLRTAPHPNGVVSHTLDAVIIAVQCKGMSLSGLSSAGGIPIPNTTMLALYRAGPLYPYYFANSWIACSKSDSSTIALRTDSLSAALSRRPFTSSLSILPLHTRVSVLEQLDVRGRQALSIVTRPIWLGSYTFL